jgi:transposase
MPVVLPKELPTDVKECHELLLEQARDIECYQARIEHLLRKLFGRKSERLTEDENNFLKELFPEEERVEPQPPAEEAAPEEKPANGSTPRRPGKRGLRSLPSDLPRERIEHDLPAGEKVCAECGCEKKRIGEQTSEQLEYVPASLYIIEHVCPKYACPACQGHVAQGEKPAQPIEKGLPGPGLLSHVITNKYADHLPLNRQESIFARYGVELSRSTLCDWTMAAAETLEPVVKEMRKRVLQSVVIHTDDTPVPVQAKRKTRKCYLWTYLGDASNPYTIYDFTETRGRAGPETFLEKYKGYLQADAFSGYDKLYLEKPILEVACMAHARRKFYEAKETDPLRAHMAMLRIRALYDIERLLRDSTPEDRRAGRLKHAAPLLNKLHKWLRAEREQVLPKSPIGQAIAYALGNWRALCRYLCDGRLSIDNNAAERALRACVVGRKNWMFCGSERGGRAAAILYSLTQSAKRNGIDPFAYLRDLLRLIPTHPQSRISDLLPDAWKKSIQQ